MQNFNQQLTQTRDQIAQLSQQRQALRQRMIDAQQVQQHGQQLQAAVAQAKQGRIRQLAARFLGSAPDTAHADDAVIDAERLAAAHADDTAAAQMALDELQRQNEELVRQQNVLQAEVEHIRYAIALERARELSAEYRKQAEALIQTFAKARGAALSLHEMADPQAGRLYTAHMTLNAAQLVLPAAATFEDVWTGWIGGQNCWQPSQQQAESFRQWMAEL